MAAPDFSPIVDSIQLAEVIGTILGIAGAWAGLWVIVRGAQFALGALRGTMHIGTGADAPFDEELQKVWDYHHGKRK